MSTDLIVCMLHQQYLMELLWQHITFFVCFSLFSQYLPQSRRQVNRHFKSMLSTACGCWSIPGSLSACFLPTISKQRYTDIKVSGNPMFHHQLPVPLDEKEEEEEETYDEINIMRPAYGVTSIEWNYVQYNIGRSRKDEVCDI